MAEHLIPIEKKFNLKEFALRNWPWTLYAIATIIIAIQRYLLNDINNFDMFEHSFPHLLEGKNLYVWYPDEYNDNYKYGPVFAVLMAPFWYLPPFVDLLLWMALNGFLFIYAINRLPGFDQKQKNQGFSQSQKNYILLFCLVEYTTSIHNSQANPAVTAMFMGTFILMERGKPFWAAALVSLGGFVKLYLLLGGAFFLLYPGKGKFLMGMVVWSLVWLVLPLAFTSPDNLLYLYKEWQVALIDKVAIHHSVSVIGLMQHLLHLDVTPLYVTAAGVVIFLAAYIRFDRYKDLTDRLLFLALVLLWSVLFSPGSESPTYVIAVAGVAVWYQLRGEGESKGKGRWAMALAAFVLIITSLGVTDLFPRAIIKTYILGYCLKALPCFVVFCVIWYRLVLEPRLEISK